MNLRVEYRPLLPTEPLPADTLAVVGFGERVPLPDDPRAIRVALEPLAGGDVVELWRCGGEVTIRTGPGFRCASGGDLTFGVIELDERDYGDVRAAAAAAYALLYAEQAGSEHPHVLRVWNHIDAINRGDGDAERYKQFSLGRGASLDALRQDWRYPAATAVGRPADEGQARRLQVYWLAGRRPGFAIENPRQVSAFLYPRQYGPRAPAFSRAMLLEETPLLMISGTASIVGHASLHPGDLLAQCRESLANLRSVIRRAAERQPALGMDLGMGSALKVYVREPGGAAAVAEFLRVNLDPAVSCLVLQADICRQDLLVEIDGLHGPAAAVDTRPARPVWHNSSDKPASMQFVASPGG